MERMLCNLIPHRTDAGRKGGGGEARPKARWREKIGEILHQHSMMMAKERNSVVFPSTPELVKQKVEKKKKKRKCPVRWRSNSLIPGKILYFSGVRFA